MQVLLSQDKTSYLQTSEAKVTAAIAGRQGFPESCGAATLLYLFLFQRGRKRRRWPLFAKRNEKKNDYKLKYEKKYV